LLIKLYFLAMNDGILVWVAKPPAHHTESDGSVTFDVVEYSSSTGHVIRCISPGPGKVECY
jgi:hypothetical protein